MLLYMIALCVLTGIRCKNEDVTIKELKWKFDHEKEK